MNHLIVAHDDMDGFVSAEILMAMTDGDYNFLDVLFVDYTFDYNELLKYDGADTKLYILDFSFKQPAFSIIYTHFNGNVVWIDHHKIIKEIDLDGLYVDGKREIGKCGALLTYEWMAECYRKNLTLNGLAIIVDAYDCWKTGSIWYEEACLLNTFFYATRPDIDTMIAEIENDYPNGRMLDNAFRIEAAKKCKDKAYDVNLKIPLEGIQIVTGLELQNAVSGPWLTMEGVRGSRNFDSMTKSGYNGMIAYQFDGKLWSVSLYSEREDVDCAEICKRFGGGGHKGAAGFTATTQQMIERGIF